MKTALRVAVVAIVIAVAAVYRWWPQSPSPRPAPAPPSPSLKVAQATPHAPEAENLRPGDVVGEGKRFAARTRLGGEVTGVMFAARAKRAPVLVIVAAQGETVEAWREPLNRLRETRDYHLAWVEPVQEPWRWLERLEAIPAVAAIEAAVDACLRDLKSDGVVVLGSGDGAAAALVLSATRQDILATALLDPKLPPTNSRWIDLLAEAPRRQSWWLCVEARCEVGAHLRRQGAMATVRFVSGGSGGLSMLTETERGLSGLAGWLFAVTPSVADPLRPAND